MARRMDSDTLRRIARGAMGRGRGRGIEIGIDTHAEPDEDEAGGDPDMDADDPGLDYGSDIDGHDEPDDDDRGGPSDQDADDEAAVLDDLVRSGLGRTQSAAIVDAIRALAAGPVRDDGLD